MANRLSIWTTTPHCQFLAPSLETSDQEGGTAMVPTVVQRHVDLRCRLARAVPGREPARAVVGPCPA